MEVKTAQELMEMALVAAQSKEDQALSWLLGNFAANAKVEFSEEVGNVRIQKTGAEWMVSFNPEFAKKYFSVPDDVLFVLLHEIMHKTTSDPRQGLNPQMPLNLPVLEMVTDILINARLCRIHFHHSAPFFEKLYQLDRFPDILLVPPMVLDWARLRTENNAASYYDAIQFNRCDGYMFPWLCKAVALPAFEKVTNFPGPLDDTVEYEGHVPPWQWEKIAIVPGLIDWYMKPWTELEKCAVKALHNDVAHLFQDMPMPALLGEHQIR